MLAGKQEPWPETYQHHARCLPTWLLQLSMPCMPLLVSPPECPACRTSHTSCCRSRAKPLARRLKGCTGRTGRWRQRFPALSLEPALQRAPSSNASAATPSCSRLCLQLRRVRWRRALIPLNCGTCSFLLPPRSAIRSRLGLQRLYPWAARPTAAQARPPLPTSLVATAAAAAAAVAATRRLLRRQSSHLSARGPPPALPASELLPTAAAGRSGSAAPQAPAALMGQQALQVRVQGKPRAADHAGIAWDVPQTTSCTCSSRAGRRRRLLCGSTAAAATAVALPLPQR